MDEIFLKLRDVKLILFDVEGVLLFKEDLDNHGKLNRIIFHLHKFTDNVKKLGLHVCIVTARADDDITKSLAESGIDDILTASIDKVSLAKELIDKYNLDFSNVFFISDDIVDLPLIQKVSVSATPMNARREVKRRVDYVTKDSNIEEILDEIHELFRIANIY